MWWCRRVQCLLGGCDHLISILLYGGAKAVSSLPVVVAMNPTLHSFYISLHIIYIHEIFVHLLLLVRCIVSPTSSNILLTLAIDLNYFSYFFPPLILTLPCSGICFLIPMEGGFHFNLQFGLALMLKSIPQ